MRDILRSAAWFLALAGCGAAPLPGPTPPHLAVEASFGLVVRTRGSAVPLEGGLVLTAAHVVDEATLREEMCRLGRWPAEPVPYLAGLSLRGAAGVAVPATRLRLGRSTFTAQGTSYGTGQGTGQSCDLAYRDGEDLALLQPAAPMAGPGVPVCAADPQPGQWVTAFSGGQMRRGRLAGEAAEAEPANGRYAVVALRLELGDSGGGVFDADQGCLLGIISMRDPAEPGHSWLVRAAVIRAFLATR